ncbi:hypothetical protein ACP275_01G078000 [Erythranthe tilingii]
MSAEYKRNITDIANLKRAGFEVNMPDDSVSYFSVKFHGPQNNLKLVFGTFLPQLLEELNADDPLNVEAANLMKYYSSAYEQRVRDETEEHAKPAAVNAAAEEGAENID